MAIDTAEKRRSVAGIPFFIFLGVTPNVAKDAEWRQQAGWGYSGIAASGGGGVAEYRKIISLTGLTQTWIPKG